MHTTHREIDLETIPNACAKFKPVPFKSKQKWEFDVYNCKQHTCGIRFEIFKRIPDSRELYNIIFRKFVALVKKKKKKNLINGNFLLFFF